jgi:Ca2+-transporting ATPase
MVRDKPLAANPYLYFALGISLGLQLICLAIPPLGHLLKLTELSLIDGLVIAASALMPLLINESTKK